MTTRSHFVCLGLLRGEQVVANNLRANQSGLHPKTRTKISTSWLRDVYCFVFVFVFIMLMYFVTLDCKQRPLSRSANFTLAFYEVPKKKNCNDVNNVVYPGRRWIESKCSWVKKVQNSALKISFLLRLLVLKISLSTSGLQRVSRQRYSATDNHACAAWPSKKTRTRFRSRCPP